MGYLILVFLVLCIGGITGIVKELSAIAGPVLVISAIVIGITLFLSYMSNKEE